MKASMSNKSSIQNSFKVCSFLKALVVTRVMSMRMCALYIMCVLLSSEKTFENHISIGDH